MCLYNVLTEWVNGTSADAFLFISILKFIPRSPSTKLKTARAILASASMLMCEEPKMRTARALDAYLANLNRVTQKASLNRQAEIVRRKNFRASIVASPLQEPQSIAQAIANARLRTA